MSEESGKVSVSQRLNHITWAWYSLTMSSGGIASLYSTQPHTFRGLQTIGKIVFIFELVAFVIITSLLIKRFQRHPRIFLRSLQNPTELFFVPTSLLSLATMILNIQAYGVPLCGQWLITTVRVLYWIYIALSFLMAVFIYFYLFTSKEMTPQDMAPSWILPIFPVMLAGELASFITSSQPQTYRMSILVAGLTMQGLAFWAAIPLYAIFMIKLFSSGLPSANLRAAMFIAVGPPAYTIVALIRMSTSLPQVQSSYFHLHPTAAENLSQLALAFGIFIWTLAFWFFSFALLSCLLALPKMSFSCVFYSMIFPNIGFTLATISIGQGLNSPAILWIGSAMTIIVTIVYIFVLLLHARALWCHQILWPGKDEDKDT